MGRDSIELAFIGWECPWTCIQSKSDINKFGVFVSSCWWNVWDKFGEESSGIDGWIGNLGGDETVDEEIWERQRVVYLSGGEEVNRKVWEFVRFETVFKREWRDNKVLFETFFGVFVEEPITLYSFGW